LEQDEKLNVNREILKTINAAFMLRMFELGSFKDNAMNRILQFYSFPVLLIFIVFTSGCDDIQTKSNLSKMQWLEGTWIRNYNQTTQVEEWEMKSNLMLGTSMFVTNGDTSIMERMKIKQRDHALSFLGFTRWVYTSTPAENTLVNVYPLLEVSADSIVFFNEAADWPQRLVYRSLPENQMEATLSGKDQLSNQSIRSATLDFRKLAD
jgi:hypothetical protein